MTGCSRQYHMRFQSFLLADQAYMETARMSAVYQQLLSLIWMKGTNLTISYPQGTEYFVVQRQGVYTNA